MKAELLLCLCCAAGAFCPTYATPEPPKAESQSVSAESIIEDALLQLEQIREDVLQHPLGHPNIFNISNGTRRKNVDITAKVIRELGGMEYYLVKSNYGGIIIEKEDGRFEKCTFNPSKYLKMDPWLWREAAKSGVLPKDKVNEYFDAYRDNILQIPVIIRNAKAEQQRQTAPAQ